MSQLELGTRIGGFIVYHAGNMGPDSQLDADLLDGIEGANYLRRDVDNTLEADVKLYTSNGTNFLQFNSSQLTVGGNLTISSTNRLYLWDTSQYIYSPDGGDLRLGSADDIYIESNFLRFYVAGGGGTEYARITSGTNWLLGSLAIGTTSAPSILTLKGTSANGMLRLIPSTTNGEASIGFFQNEDGTTTTTHWAMGVAAWGNTGKFVLGYNSGALLAVLNDGSVGIGTPSPQSLLHVHKAYAGEGAILRLSNNNTAGYNVIRFSETTDAASFAWLHGFNSTYSGADSWKASSLGIGSSGAGGVNIVASNASGAIYFYTTGTADVNERMRITNTGLVGIGTNNPSVPLEVKHQVAGATAISINGFNGRSLNFASGASDRYWKITSNSTSDIFLSYLNESGGKLKIGIGTATPDYELQVNGTIAPETSLQDLGTTALRWDLYGGFVNVTGVITSSVVTGTAPFTVASTTNVTNLNADMLDGYHLSHVVTFNSGRDFADGTLITTSISYNPTSGDAFYVEIKGNSYGSTPPFKAIIQGYIYADTIINHSLLTYGVNFPSVKAMNIGGNLCFWFPRYSYWNGFSVFAQAVTGGGYSQNRVTSIANSTDPSGTSTKVKVFDNVHKGWNSYNDGSGSGLDADLWDGNQFATYLNQTLLTTSSPTFATLTLTGDLNLTGNLNITNGEINQLSVTELNVDDNLIRLNNGGTTALADGGGIKIMGDASAVIASMLYNGTNWVSNIGLSVSSGVWVAAGGSLISHGADLLLQQTNSSNSKLVMSSAGGVIISLDYNNNEADTNDFIIGKNALKPGETNWAEIFRIQEDGKVGIGVADPLGMLDIYANNTTNGIVLRSNQFPGSKGHIGQFSGGLYIASNYYYNSGIHYADDGARSSMEINIVDDPGYVTFNYMALGFPGIRDEAMRILGNGKVGIGIAAPLAQGLHIVKAGDVDANGVVKIQQTAATNYPTLVVTQDASGGTGGQNQGVLFDIYGVATGKSFEIQNNGTARVTVLNNGNFGIGTNAPNYLFEVTGTASDSVSLGRFNITGTGGNYRRGLQIFQAGMVAAAGNEITLQIGKDDTAYDTGQLVFTYVGSGSTSNWLTLGLHSADNVLNVVGTKRVGINVTDPDSMLHVGNSTATSGEARITIEGSATAEAGIVWQSAGTNEWLMYKSNTGADLTVWEYNGAAARMTFQAGGNIGIGTTTPDYKLQVNGTIAPETTNQDLGTSALRWDLYTGNIYADGRMETYLGGVRTLTDVAQYYAGNTPNIGTIVVTFTSTPNIMLDAEISVQAYGTLWKYHIRGYTYTSTGAWHMPMVTCLSSAPFAPAVRFATNLAGDRVLLIGTTTTAWGGYPHVTVNRISYGYGAPETLSSPTISVITVETGYSGITSPAINQGFVANTATFTGVTNTQDIIASGPITTRGFTVPGISISDTVPTGASVKDLWWESDTGRLKIYYFDGASYQWVDSVPIPDMSLYYLKAGGAISGPVVINSTLTVTGNSYVEGTLIETSDERLKANILQLENPMPKLMNLRGVTFNKLTTPDHEEIGLIAQELEKEYPELVETNKDGVKSVAYTRMVAVLLEAVKSQQKEIDELKGRAR